MRSTDFENFPGEVKLETVFQRISVTIHFFTSELCNLIIDQTLVVFSDKQFTESCSSHHFSTSLVRIVRNEPGIIIELYRVVLRERHILGGTPVFGCQNF